MARRPPHAVLASPDAQVQGGQSWREGHQEEQEELEGQEECELKESVCRVWEWTMLNGRQRRPAIFIQFYLLRFIHVLFMCY